MISKNMNKCNELLNILINSVEIEISELSLLLGMNSRDLLKTIEEINRDFSSADQDIIVINQNDKSLKINSYYKFYDPTRVEKELRSQGISSYYQPIMDSTNLAALNNRAPREGNQTSLFYTEHQTHGHGRKTNFIDQNFITAPTHNVWHDNFAQDLTFSIMIPYNKNSNNNVNRLQGFSIYLGMVVLEILKRYIEQRFKIKIANTDLQFKWPNDIYSNQKKIAGIITRDFINNSVLIGIGMNVNIEAPDIFSLNKIVKNQLDRSDLLICLVQNLLNSATDWLESSKPHALISSKYAKLYHHDYLYGKKIVLHDTELGSIKSSTYGLYKGIGQHGELLLQSQSPDPNIETGDKARTGRDVNIRSGVDHDINSSATTIATDINIASLDSQHQSQNHESNLHSQKNIQNLSNSQDPESHLANSANNANQKELSFITGSCEVVR